jgi:hypothetical protein
MTRRIVILMTAATVAGTSAAWAEDAPAAAPPAPGLISGNVPILVGGVSSSPMAFGAMALNGGVIIGLGLGFAYDGALATDRFTASGLIHLAYMPVNTPRFAAGPELTFVVPFAPKGGDPLTFLPGVALWYAPFAAPVVLGAALDVAVTYSASAKAATLGIVTPGVRLGYVF